MVSLLLGDTQGQHERLVLISSLSVLLLLLGWLVGEAHVVIGAAGDLEGLGVFISCVKDWHTDEGLLRCLLA